MDNIDRSYDCVVVGAGPGGLVAATILADQGYTVAVFERERFPRYRVGESMIPFNYFPLERIGMIDKLQASDFPKKYSVQFVGRSGKQSQPFYFSQHMDHPCTQTWQVTRDVFDAMLMDNAREHGVVVLEGMKAMQLIEEDGKTVGVSCVDLAGDIHDFRSTVTLDASGGARFAMKRLSWTVFDRNLEKLAVWTYYKGAKRDPGLDEGATTIAYLEGKHWFWYIPLRDDIVSVGAVGDKDYIFRGTRDLAGILNREIQKNGWIKEHLEAGSPVGEPYRCVHKSYRSKYCAKDGLVLLGDAFSFLDPVFSTGMYLALTSGELAADAVTAALNKGDVSGGQFQAYGDTMCRRIEILRQLVYAFYAEGFSFKQIVMNYPHLKGAVTDCLIGNLDQDFTELTDALAQFLTLSEPLAHGGAMV